MNSYKLTLMSEGTLQAYVETNFPALYPLFVKAGIYLNTLPAGTALFLPTLTSDACRANLQNVNLAALTGEQAKAILLNHVVSPPYPAPLEALGQGYILALPLGTYNFQTANGQNHTLEIVPALVNGTSTKTAYVDGQSINSSFVKNGIAIYAVECVLFGSLGAAGAMGSASPSYYQPIPGGPIFPPQGPPIDPEWQNPFRRRRPPVFRPDYHPPYMLQESLSGEQNVDLKARRFYRWLRSEASRSPQVKRWVELLQEKGDPLAELTPLFRGLEGQHQALIFLRQHDFLAQDNGKKITTAFLQEEKMPGVFDLNSWEGNRQVETLDGGRVLLAVDTHHRAPRIRVDGARVEKYLKYKGDGHKIAVLTA